MLETIKSRTCLTGIGEAVLRPSPRSPAAPLSNCPSPLPLVSYATVMMMVMVQGQSRQDGRSSSSRLLRHLSSSRAKRPAHRRLGRHRSVLGRPQQTLVQVRAVGQLSLLPSAGREMSLGQSSVAWPHYRSVGTGIGDRLRAGIPPRYVTSHPGQLSLLPSVGRAMSTALRLGVKAGWLIPFVDKRVGGR